MAELDFILQAVTTANHAEAIRSLLSLHQPTQILVSVAFVRELGLDAVEAAIKPHAEVTKFFVGIRNDITSIQAIKRLLAMNVALYVVDTGSRNTIFHPKLYFAGNTEQANVVIGSANLTFGGLHNNIEASTLIRLDLSNAADDKFSKEATNVFSEMLNKHPQHVFLIKDEQHADDLFESGRLADEKVIPAPSITSGVKKGERDNLPPMKLNKIIPPRKKSSAVKGIITEKPVDDVIIKLISVTDIPLAAAAPTKYLVWESKELTERDLNIPTSAGTNPTGSMGWKKGAFDDIDQRHYFREDVFSDLNWIPDKPPSKWERTQAKFELVVKNLNYGVFDLKLSHNTDTDSTSYRQKNFMTQLHWGDTKEYIAKHDLLGRILYLYRKDTHPPEFMIEID
jgi:HKD family nuclease